MQLFKLSWSVDQIVCSLVVSNRPVVVFALPIHTVLLQYFLLAISSLCGAAEDLVPPADARANLVVLRFRVAEVVEFGLRGQHQFQGTVDNPNETHQRCHERTTEPNSISIGLKCEREAGTTKRRKHTVDAYAR